MLLKSEKKYWTWFPLLTLLIGIGLRLVYINAPLHSDELATTSIWAQMPLLKIPSNYQYPNNHIFHTMLINLILKVFGVNHVLIRLPVLFCGCLSLGLGYWTTLKITKEKSVALGVLILLAVNGKHIYYSTYARGYMLIMVFIQIIFYLLLTRFQNGNGDFFSSPPELVGAMPLICIGLLCFAGTWTVPTFVFFEAAIFAFFGAFLLFKFRNRIFNLRFPYTQVLLVLSATFVGFYVQYYVFIPKEMLHAAITRTTKGISQLAEFIPGLLDLLVQPLGSFRYIFLLLAGTGMIALFKKSKNLFFLFSCLFFIPVGMAIFGAISGVLPAVPVPRTFLYLQPFFFTCVCMGTYFILQTIHGWFAHATFFARAGAMSIHIPFYLLLLPVIFFSGNELINKTYPEKKNRTPYHKVFQFVKNLGPHDLFLTSTKHHVWFYLYGAGEMRKRVNNIIDHGELGGVYFLEATDKNGNSDVKKITKEGIDYFQFFEYTSYDQAKEKEPMAMPAEIFRLAADYGVFKIYKIKPQFIQKVYALDEVKNLHRWIVPPYGPVRLKTVNVGIGTQIAISFRWPFLLLSKKIDSHKKEDTGWNINFLCTQLSHDHGVAYINGMKSGDELLLQPAWMGNDFVMDHPYGRNIFNRDWQPVIFISRSGASREILAVSGPRTRTMKYIRGVQSYRISIPADEATNQ